MFERRVAFPICSAGTLRSSDRSSASSQHPVETLSELQLISMPPDPPDPPDPPLFLASTSSLLLYLLFPSFLLHCFFADNLDKFLNPSPLEGAIFHQMNWCSLADGPLHSPVPPDQIKLLLWPSPPSDTVHVTCPSLCSGAVYSGISPDVLYLGLGQTLWLLSFPLWKGLLSSTSAPFNAICLSLFCLQSSSVFTERSFLSSSSFWERISLPPSLFWRGEFSTVLKPRKPCQFVTALLSCVVVFWRPKDATEFVSMNFRGVNCRLKSQVKVTISQVLGHAVNALSTHPISLDPPSFYPEDLSSLICTVFKLCCFNQGALITPNYPCSTAV